MTLQSTTWIALCRTALVGIVFGSGMLLTYCLMWADHETNQARLNYAAAEFRDRSLALKSGEKALAAEKKQFDLDAARQYDALYEREQRVERQLETLGLGFRLLKAMRGEPREEK